MRVIVAALFALACSAGCDEVFRLHRDDAAIDVIDTAPIDEAPPDLGCSTISMLDDRFDVDDLALRWPGSYAAPGAITVAGGRLVMTNNMPNAYVTVESIYYYDIRDRAFTVKTSDDGVFPAGAYLNIALVGETPDRSMTIERTNTQLLFIVHDATGDHFVTTLPYDAQFAYWRLVFTGDSSVAFETSADGVQYTQHATRSVDGFAFVRASMQTFRPPAAPEFLVYVDEIGNGSPEGHACPVAQLHDDFSAPTLAAQWTRTVAYAGSYQLDQQSFLAITNGVPPGSAATVALLGSRVYDLREGTLSVEIPQMVMPSPEKQVAISASVPGGDSVTLQQVNGRLNAFALHDGAALNPFGGTYVASTMRWWRIRNASGSTHWEVSPDGTIWTSLSSTTALVGLEHVTIDIRVYTTTTDEDVARFDNVNTP